MKHIEYVLRDKDGEYFVDNELYTDNINRAKRYTHKEAREQWYFFTNEGKELYAFIPVQIFVEELPMDKADPFLYDKEQSPAKKGNWFQRLIFK